MPYKGKGRNVYLHNELYDKLSSLRGHKTWDRLIGDIFNENQKNKTAELEQAKAKPLEALPETPAENKEDANMAGETCVNCQFKDRDIAKLKEEVIPALKSEAEKTAKELAAQVEALKVQLAEKPAPMPAHAVPDDMDAVIEHCESGICPGHAAWWANKKAELLEINTPAIAQNVMENLPDTVIESEGLKRGFIPQRITIPIRARR
jgi:hypothetical protein